MARHALVIGISQYDHLATLESVVQDVEAIASILKQSGNYIVDRYPYRYIEAEDRYEFKKKSATHQDLLATIETFLFETAKNSDALLYLSGHGLRVTSPSSRIPPKGYLAATDSTKDGHHALLFTDLNTLFAKARQEAHLSSLIVILDCCHAGMILEFENSIEWSMISEGFSTFTSEPKYALLAACRSHQEAYFQQGGLSDFTKTIIEGFKIENSNEFGVITFSRLAEFVKLKLMNQGQQAIDLSVDASDIEIVKYEPSIQPRVNSINFIEALHNLNYSSEDFVFNQFLESSKPVGAFWVCGDEGSGQTWLLQRFWRGKQSQLFTNAFQKKFDITRRWSIETVWERVGDWLEVESNPTQIINELYQQWLNQITVALFLFGVERLESDVVQQLSEQLWKPLAQKAFQHESKYPLLLFLVDTGNKNNYECSLRFVSQYDCLCPEQHVKLELKKFNSKTLEFWGDRYCDLLNPMLQNCASLDVFKQQVTAYNNRDDVCTEDVLKEICHKCGQNWERDIASKFAL